MIHARSLHGAVVFRDILLVIGGKDDKNNILSSIEKYNEKDDTWEEFMISLPEPRMAMGVKTWRDILWIAGGLTSVNGNVAIVDSVWCFDNTLGTWFRRPRLPKPLAFTTLLHDGGELMCIGGAIRVKDGDEYILQSVDSVYRLDESKEPRWKKEVKMPSSCHNVVATSLNGNVYVLGGFSTKAMEQMASTTYFERRKQKWLPLVDLPENSAGFVVAVCKHIKYRK
ncbi:alpha-scruin [Caerostris darwini]|uniref:Alpha-scruin n=1 Tax=Caerostris darwini TaxID=1538125 RepID=A0AAV4TKA3_9ARAC|nr:alpha-scruin [Caerostris darwini]